MENKRFNWIFTKEELQNTPSRKCGIDAEKELAYRQQAASMIQDMGQRLQVNQLCINTALVYMHRFYMFHSFTKFHRNMVGPACIFLAAKVEEQPRKLEHVLKERHRCLYRDGPPFDNKSEAYLEQAQELVISENILLQTLGFDITVDHPHTHVVKTCQLVRASKDFAQTSYFLATNSLHLTTMCLQYPPTVVACVCIHLASKWADYQINTSKEGKEWYWYINKNVTIELLEDLANDFLTIVDKCPEKLKKSIMAKVTKRGILDKEEEQPAKKRICMEPSATVSNAASTSSDSRPSHPAVMSTKLVDDVDIHKVLEMQHVEFSPGRHGAMLEQSVGMGHLLPITAEPSSSQTLATMASGVHEQIVLPLVVDNIKQEKVPTSVPEKLSLRDYRQRIEQRPVLPPAPVPAVLPDAKVENVVRMPQHVTLKEAKVVVQDIQHSHGHDKLMFTTAQHAYDASRRRQSSGSHSEADKRKHHHHHHHHNHGGQEVSQKDEAEHHRQGRSEEHDPGRSRESESKSSLKVHIKRESSGAHHIHRSSPSSLKLKIKRDPDSASVHAASDSNKAEKEKKESLKLRLPINSSGRSEGDKHSRSKGHDSSSAQTPQKLTILMGSGGSTASGGVLVSGTAANSNGHSDRKRSRHSRSHSHVLEQSMQHSSSTRPQDSSLHQSSSSSSLTSAPPPPPPDPLLSSAPSVGLPFPPLSSSHYRHISHHPPLQTQFSGFSLTDSFLEQMPENIFDTDTLSNPGDMNGLEYDAPQTPTAENLKQVQVDMEQMMAQHKSRHHLHNSFHMPPPPPPPPHHMYLENCYPHNPPLPPPLPPEPNPPPPPPPPPSH